MKKEKKDLKKKDEKAVKELKKAENKKTALTEEPAKDDIVNESISPETMPAAEEQLKSARAKDKHESIQKEKGKLCKLVKNEFLKNHLKEYQRLVNAPEYICKKCGRIANDKKSLCSPQKLG